MNIGMYQARRGRRGKPQLIISDNAPQFKNGKNSSKQTMEATHDK